MVTDHKAMRFSFGFAPYSSGWTGQLVYHRWTFDPELKYMTLYGPISDEELSSGRQGLIPTLGLSSRYVGTCFYWCMPSCHLTFFCWLSKESCRFEHQCETTTRGKMCRVGSALNGVSCTLSWTKKGYLNMSKGKLGWRTWSKTLIDSVV